MVAHGFDVQTEDVNNLADIKAEKGVPTELLSCHTVWLETTTMRRK